MGRGDGPEGTDYSLATSVDQTPLFSLRENAIAKEPGLSYPESWRCVVTRRFTGGRDRRAE